MSSLSCIDSLASLRVAAAAIGNLSFASMAILVAVLTFFIELYREKKFVDLSLFKATRLIVSILAAEVIAWVAVGIGGALPFEVIPCISWFVVAVEVLMYAGIALAGIILAWFMIRFTRKLR